MHRRHLLLSLGAAPLLALPRIGSATAQTVEGPSELLQQLADSPLLYLTPLQSSGQESRCQAELWFVQDGGSAVVCTRSRAWRSRALRQGLTTARLWIGDAGVWTSARGAYRALPSTLAEGSVVGDAAAQQRLLLAFGKKYRREWGVWGPRFKRGLRDGSRVLLRYELPPNPSG